MRNQPSLQVVHIYAIINCPLGPKGRFQSEAEKELSIINCNNACAGGSSYR